MLPHPCLTSPLRPQQSPSQADALCLSARGNLRSLPQAEIRPQRYRILGRHCLLEERQSLLENSLRKTNDGKNPPPTPSLPGGSQASLGQGDWIPPLAEPTHSPSGIIRTPYEQAVPSNSSRALTMMSSFIAQDGHSSCTETLLSTPSVPGPV